jgi:hypothetical protein
MTQAEIVEKIYEKTIEQQAEILFQELMIEDRNDRHASAKRRFQNGLKAATFARERALSFIVAILLALFLSTTASGQEVGPGERLRQIEIEKALQNERFERAREMGEGAKLRFQQLLQEENELKAKLGPSKTDSPAKTK